MVSFFIAMHYRFYNVFNSIFLVQENATMKALLLPFDKTPC